MLSRLLKEHQAKQNERKELQERRRREAIAAATCLTEALVDHLNVGVAQAYVNQRKLDHEVKMLDVEVLGWCGYMWSAVVRPVGCTATFSETPLETAYGREMNIQFTGNSSGEHSCSQHANCTLPQNLRHLWHCAL
uniref:Biogenesis of lysosome-related organelles complex 1 subunit 1 n=1 Tax=Cyprinus carpio carpio TaxID=630221 RepID=A0A9J8CX27_CYPCA